MGKTVPKYPLRCGQCSVVILSVPCNRNADSIENSNRSIIDRPRPAPSSIVRFWFPQACRQRAPDLRFNFLWEEIPARLSVIELIEQPKRIYSNRIHGIDDMKLRVPE